MRNILIIILFFLISFDITYPAVKVNISFDNWRIQSGFLVLDINAQILSGQAWCVGSSNIRVDWITIPPNTISVKADNPAYNPNPNIHSNMNYAVMTTTSINGGFAISLNISRINNCYTFTPGTYRLGSIRFLILDSNSCFRLTIRTTSVLQDFITQLFYPADWTTTIDTICHQIWPPGGMNINGSEIPRVFKLYNNYPNPFNPVTKIKFDIPKPGNAKITIYDILGQETAILLNELLKPGTYELEFDGTNYPSGVYFYKLETEYDNYTKRMMLVK